jgi:transposase InsO family protein
VEHVVAALGVPERRACRVLGQHRSTQRKPPTRPDDETALTAAIIALATRYGRYGYRRITALLQAAGGVVNRKRVERLWRREGLKVPARQPKRGRLWLNDGSCTRLRPEYANHVWSYDFVEDRTHDGRKYRLLNVIDEFTRECLAIRVDRKLSSTDVVDVLSELFILRGIPGHVRSDHGPGFVAKAVRGRIATVGARTAYIEPGSPWENGLRESLNGKLRDELLDREVFHSLREAQVLIEGKRRQPAREVAFRRRLPWGADHGWDTTSRDPGRERGQRRDRRASAGGRRQRPRPPASASRSNARYSRGAPPPARAQPCSTSHAPRSVRGSRML